MKKPVEVKKDKYAYEFKKGKCVICLEKTEVKRRMNNAWICSPCLTTMAENGRKRAAEANLFGRTGVFN